MYDAFAMHYLSDQFASGHIRVPRPEFNFPGNARKSLGLRPKILKLTILK